MNKFIVVGLNPGSGASIRRFESWCETIGIKSYPFMNMSSDPNWDFRWKTLSEKDKENLCTKLDGYDSIICWGNKVESYIKRLGYNNFFTIPHPSGLNRKLNDKQYVNRKLFECGNFIRNIS